MRVVIQRVKYASVEVDTKVVASIKKGLLVLVGIEDADNDTDIEWMAKKIVNLRIFDDEEAIPNLSVNDVNAEILLVSQFTLHASTKKGNRPSYIKASKGIIAAPIFEKLCAAVQSDCLTKIGRGMFGAHMDVALLNDGPVTIIMDSKNKE